MLNRKQMEALRKSKLFCAMSEEEIREYLSKAAYQIRTFNRNAAIFPAGEPCKWVDILLEGRADCHRADEKGNLMVLELMAPDKAQARYLEKGFQEKAEILYNMLMTELLDET